METDWLKEAKAAYSKRNWEAAIAAATIALAEEAQLAREDRA